MIGFILKHEKPDRFLLNYLYNPAILEKELALELQRQRLINKALESQSETHKKMQERASQIETKLEKQGKLTQEMRDRMEL